MNSLDSSKSSAPLKGLAITVAKFSELENLSTLGSEYYLPEFVHRQNVLRGAGKKIFTLGDISELITDGDHGSADYQDEGIPFLLSENVKEGWIDTSDIRYISAAHHKKLTRSSLAAGDVVVTKTGAYFGKSAVIPPNFGEANTIAHVGKITLKSDFDPYYVSTFLNCAYGYAQLRRRGIKATRPEIKLVEFNDIEIVFPGCQLIQNLRAVIEEANLSRLRASEIQLKAETYLLSELGFSDSNTPHPLTYVARSSELLSAGRWDAQYFQPKYHYLLNKLNATRAAVALGEVLDVNTRGRQPQYADQGFKVVNSRHVRKNRVVLDEQNRLACPAEGNVQIECGDVLLNGTGVGTIGRAAPYTHNTAALPDNHVTILRTKSLDPIYLSAFLNSPIGQLQIERFIRGSSGQIELYPSDIAKLVAWKAAPSIQETVRKTISLAFELEKAASVLLHQAQRAVEISIEQDDATAISYLSTREGL